MAAAVIDVDEATFERDVIERSNEVPVVVDFWASWCGPCRQLSPILERLAAEASGGWILAKVDVDANQMLAARHGVQGIPAVRAFRDGREVAEFVGALPEAHVRAWLAQLGPTEGDLAASEGEEAEARGDLEAAENAYRRALAAEPANGVAKAGLARVGLAKRTAEGDEVELRARAARDPGDVGAVTRLADLEFASGDVDAALRRLVDLAGRSDTEDRERARVHLLGLLDTLPVDDLRALEARRALANILY